MESRLRAAVGKVLRSGTFILGPEVRAFEREFARFCGGRFAVGVASGTDALELGLRALGVGAGDTVATVSFTFMGTVDALRHAGARPLFIEIDPGTYTMDPEDLRLKLERLGPAARRRVKAIVPVHLFGQPCDMDRIGRVARSFRVPVLEDAAQAAGASWRGRAVGSSPGMAAFSFFPTKNLGACGDGGIVVMSSSSAAGRLRALRVHGRSPQGKQVALGRNSRLDEMQAAILRVKLRRLPEWVRGRRRLAAEYDRGLAGMKELTCPAVRDGASHAYHLYTVRTPHRGRLAQALRRHRIGFGLYYATPVHAQPLGLRAWGRVPLPETERAAREVLSLPIYPELTVAEVRRVCAVVRSALR